MIRLTPAMQQYMRIKNQYPDCIVMFRMGDFYEMFFEDAKTAANELDIVLTSRGKGDTKAPLAGIPYHSIEPYLAKLVKKGYKVAICEQMEDPRFAKGIVKRDLVRIITPGTLIDSIMLEEKSNNYIMSLFKEKECIGIALADISTGEFLTTQFNSLEQLRNEITRFSPSEIIFPMSLEKSDFILKLKDNNLILNSYDDRHFWREKCNETLKEHFNVLSLDGFGLNEKKLSINASGALISYLKETQKTSLAYINNIKLFNTENFMCLDSSTIRNLELVRNIRDNSSRGTLLSILDNTITVMGSRLLKKWLLQPLLDIENINERLDCVEELTTNVLLREELKEKLKNIQDLERLISRIMYGNSNARDLILLKNSLKIIPFIKDLLKDVKSRKLRQINKINEQKEVVELIEKAILEEPSAVLNEGNLIKKGYNEELDKLQELIRKGKNWIIELEEKERRRTGIKSLKIKYNKVFGYFIEVTKSNLHLVPSDYIRKQTQVNSERFITDDLKKQEELVLNAEEKIINLEYKLFQDVIKRVSEKTVEIQNIARNIAELDCLLNFSIIAIDNNYKRPLLKYDNNIFLKDSRHPVLEKIEQNYVPNDIVINEENRTLIITGPNMAGKSSIMRQVALIVLMAQIGSFVPVTHASIGIVDRIFTRVGAFDDIYSGQSTFMVEMSETANILNNATENSLIILDEIGRGTSTYDGISIAWAVAEYIHNNIKARIMFATHYHQLNKLAENHNGIKNLNVAVNESEDKIIFLHKLVEGGTDKSYGIQVAKLAGLPKEVIERSKVIMNRLEMEDEISERIHRGLKNNKKKKITTKEVEKRKRIEPRQTSLLGL
jgi:DNA mismatch repair protein MutS